MSRSLAVRMVLVAVLTPLIALGLLALVFALTPSRYVGGLVIGLLIGLLVRIFRRGKQPEGRILSERDAPELHEIVNRLCALADIERPELFLVYESQPNSWVTHAPGRRPRLCVTRGLRETLNVEELTAVLGHELAHIANRDALVMTVVGAPAAAMSRVNGAAGLDAIPVWLIGCLSGIGVMILSRYREVAADAGSCAIAGRPSALASALLKVSDALEQIPRKDLRAAQALNAFNLVAVPRRGALLRRFPFLARMTATHPPLRARLDALEALERAQQGTL